MVSQLGYKRNFRRFSRDEIAHLKATFKPDPNAAFNQEEKPYIGASGSVVGGCDHILDFAINGNQEWEKVGLVIGGLDASQCRLCACWWVNSKMRVNLLTKRGGFSESVRDNGN